MNATPTWREALEFAAETKSTDWPERCQKMVDMARKALMSDLKQKPVAWTLKETIEAKGSLYRAPLWFTDPKNSAWVPLYTVGAPQQAEAAPFNHATQLQIAYVKGLGDGAMQAVAVPPDVVRDAERYRWLCCESRGVVPRVRVLIMDRGQYLHHKDPDAAIDAAMRSRKEPAMSDAYDMIDRFLRNNLGSDDDYAEYSKALDSLCGAQPAQAGQGLTDDALWELWNAQGCDDMNQSEAMKFARAIEAAVLAKRVPMPPEDWHIFNSGAEVASGLTWAEALDYMTPSRIERGWTAVCVADKSNIGIVGEKGGA